MISDLSDTDLESVDDSLYDPNYSPKIRRVLDTDSISDTGSEPDEETEFWGILLEHNLTHTEDNTGAITDNRKQRHKNRNEGKTYTTKSGKIVPAKSFTPLQQCKKKCKDKVSIQHQSSIFSQYWALASFSLRVAYIAGLIVIDKTKVSTNIKSIVAPRNRKYSYRYYLDVDAIRINVCQKCFLKTFGETDRFVRTVISKKLNGIDNLPDKRGKCAPPNKLNEDKVKEIIDHINSFPAYESHYTRKVSAVKYLAPDLSIAEMYRSYSVKINQPASISMYTKMFKTLNLKFKSPKVDTCTTCDTYHLKIQVSEGKELQILQNERDSHQESAEFAYETKRNDIKNI